jgi:FlaA1/EpsC-like NDP-sugar epimerase
MSLSVVYLFVGYYLVPHLFSLPVPNRPVESFLFYITLNFIFMVLLNTFSGIIRFSTLDEIKRLVQMLACSAVAIWILDRIQAMFFGHLLISTISLVTLSILGFQALFFFRLFVKSAYELAVRNDKSGLNTLFIGKDIKSFQSALSTLKTKALNLNISSGFLLEGSGHGLTVNGLSVYFKNHGSFGNVNMLQFDAVLLSKNAAKNPEVRALIGSLETKDIKIFFVNTEPELLDNNPKSDDIVEAQISDILSREEIVLEPFLKNDSISNKVVLVTGGAGSIGSEIIRQLVKFKPQTILILDNAETPLHNLELELQEIDSVNFRYILADINDEDYLEEVFIKYAPTIVYHAAAYKHVPMMERNARQSLLTNIQATINLAKVAEKHKSHKFIYVSTDKAVNPVGVMGMSKRISEIYLSAFFHNNLKSNPKTCKFIFTRFGNVLKSNGSVVHLFEEQIKKGGPVTITDPEITRYFMSIEEASSLVIEASVMGNGGEFYVFDMGDPIKIKDLAEKLIKFYEKPFGNEVKIEYTGLRPGEKMYEELIYDKAKDLPTHHPKILISKDEPQNYHLTDILTSDLFNDLKQLNNKEIKLKLNNLMEKLHNIEISKNNKLA